MEIKATPEEIAALVAALQERRDVAGIANEITCNLRKAAEKIQ